MPGWSLAQRLTRILEIQTIDTASTSFLLDSDDGFKHLVKFLSLSEKQKPINVDGLFKYA